MSDPINNQSVTESYWDTSVTGHPVLKAGLPPSGKALPPDWFVPTTYGAKGDGTTLDHVAINAAIADLNANGGGTLWLPATASYYKCTAPLTPLSNAVIAGPGCLGWATSGGGVDFLTLAGGVKMSVRLRYISGSGSFIHITGDNCTVDKVVLDDVSGLSDQFLKVSAERTKIVNCDFVQYTTNNGVIVVDGAYRDTLIKGNTFWYCTGRGAPSVSIKNGATHVRIVDNLATGLVSDGAAGVVLNAAANDFYVITNNDFGGAAVTDNSTGSPTKTVGSNI